MVPFLQEDTKLE